MQTPSPDLTAANFRAFADRAAVIMWITDATGYCLALNNKWYAFTGQAPGEGEGIGWTNAVHEADRLAAKTSFLEASAAQSAFHAEYRLLRRDGTYRWVIDFAEPRFGESGEYQGYMGSVVDITERKEAEDALRAAHERLQRAQAAAKLGTFEWDMRTNGLEWSGGIYPLLGLEPFSRDPSLDLVMQCVPAEDREQVSKQLTMLTSRVGAFDFEFRVVGFDGTERWIASIAEVEAGPDGRPAVMRGVDIDVTERRLTRQALAESSAHLAAVFEQTAAGMCEVDLTGRILRVNQRYCEVVGRKAEELLRLRMQDITHEEDLPANLPLFRKTVETGESFQIEKRYVRPDGSFVWVNNTVSRILLPGESEEQKRVTVLAVVVDITARKAAEDALRLADKRKDEFLAMLAHELRSPLAPISTAAHLLKAAPADPARVQRSADIIDRQVRHMTELVDDLLDVSRVTRGLVKLERAPVELKAVVTYAIEQVRPMIDARGHQLTTRMASGDVYVMGDRTRLVQVVSNLLNNAAKYTPPNGSLAVSLVVGEQVEVRVADNGIGIESELLPHVFELFTQGERTPERAQGGLGLGLALVRSLVELHGGRVRAESEGTGRGSAFAVTLPLLRVASAGESSERQRGDLPRAARRLRVMVVDDNKDAAETLDMLLKTMGHDVRVVHDPSAAIELAGFAPFDVFILDIGLPDMNGYELARRLRPRSGAMPTFIALTGYGGSEDRQRGEEAGFDHYLVKPASAGELAGLLQRASIRG